MPKFKFTFRRTYTISEGFDRTIEAPSYAEAQAAAANLESEFNHDCPDDCSEIESGYTEIGDFEAHDFNDAPLPVHSTDNPDFVVAADGQCHPA